MIIKILIFASAEILTTFNKLPVDRKLHFWKVDWTLDYIQFRDFYSITRFPKFYLL